MILAFVTAALLGVAQFYMLYRGIAAVIKKDYLKAAAFVCVKALVYLVSITVLVFGFKEFVLYGAIGFGAGFFPATAVYLIKTVLKKDTVEKEEKNFEQNGDN